MAKLDFPPLEFCKVIRKCRLCGKPTYFFILEEMWGRVDVGATPTIQYLEQPTCSECYKKWEREYRWGLGVFQRGR